MDARIEVIVLPVTDIDRAIEFYCEKVDFGLDVDYRPTAVFRVVQLTPPGSGTSIQFGLGLADMPASPVAGLYLVVEDIDDYRNELSERGVCMAEPQHKDGDGGWSGTFLPGWDSERLDYASFTGFSDPDGNRWVIQERGYPPVPHSGKAIAYPERTPP